MPAKAGCASTPWISGQFAVLYTTKPGLMFCWQVVERNINWHPLSEVELWEEIVRAEERMTPAQARLWEAIRNDPRKWAQDPYGKEGAGFWAVALLGQRVVWYNDIEHGFNVSHYEKFGNIGEYWCNQDQLEHTVQSVLNLIEAGRGLQKCGPPIPEQFTR